MRNIRHGGGATRRRQAICCVSMATSCARVRRHPTPPESSRALPQGLDPRTGHGDPKQVTQKPQQPAGSRSASHSSMTQRGHADGVRAQLQRLRERAVGAPEPLRRPAQRRPTPRSRPTRRGRPAPPARATVASGAATAMVPTPEVPHTTTARTERLDWQSQAPNYEPPTNAHERSRTHRARGACPGSRRRPYRTPRCQPSSSRPVYVALGADLTDNSSRAAPVSVGVASTGRLLHRPRPRHRVLGLRTGRRLPGESTTVASSWRRGAATGLRSGLWSAGVRDSRIGAVAGRVGGRSAGVGGNAFTGAFLSPCGRHTFALPVPAHIHRATRAAESNVSTRGLWPRNAQER